MAMKLRLSRGGAKKRPFYRLGAAHSRRPRDGRDQEKQGIYNPPLAQDSEDRVRMDLDRVQYWLSQGAQPTDRVSRMLEAAGILPKKDRANLKKGVPGKKAADRAAQKADKATEAADAAAE